MIFKKMKNKLFQLIKCCYNLFKSLTMYYKIIKNLLSVLSQKFKLTQKEMINLDNDESITIFEKMAYLVLEMYNLLADGYADFQ